MNQANQIAKHDCAEACYYTDNERENRETEPGLSGEHRRLFGRQNAIARSQKWRRLRDRSNDRFLGSALVY